MNDFREIVTLDAEKNPGANGFWTTKARFARAGVQTYSRIECLDWPGIGNVRGQTVKVYRPESVVFDVEAMKSFENVPITIEHEAGFVTPDNARRVVVGAAGYPVTREGDSLVVPVTVFDGAAIMDAKTKIRNQLSAGYEPSVEYKPGVYSGESYDYVMTAWKGNHITITRSGKAGPEFFIGDKKMPDEKKIESVEKTVIRALDGVNYTFTEQAGQVFDRVLGERDAARAELEKTKKLILDDSEIERRVADRVAVVDAAKTLVKDGDFVGKTTDAIVSEVVKVHYEGLDTKGKSADYVRALFDSAVLSASKAPAKTETTDRALVGPANDKAPDSSAAVARAKFIATGSGRGK